MTSENLEQFHKSYLQSAVFADLEEEYIGRLDEDNIAPESINSSLADCEKFLTPEVCELIENDEHIPGSHDDTAYEHAGRDFWYTRHGHGVGFWDGDWPINGDKLTKLAKTFEEKILYVGDNGSIYIA
jgi:hypothetical protein